MDRSNVTGFFTGLLVVTLLIAACQTQPTQVFIDVDGGRQSLTTALAFSHNAISVELLTVALKLNNCAVGRKCNILVIRFYC